MVANPDAGSGGGGGGALMEANPDEAVVGGGRVSYICLGGLGFTAGVTGDWLLGTVLGSVRERGDAGLPRWLNWIRSEDGCELWPGPPGPLLDIDGEALVGVVE
jgi:hypothetical protein